MRLRDDKSDGNHKDVVENVVQTILDPVGEPDVSNTPFEVANSGLVSSQLIARCPSIRAQWKAREAAGGSGPTANAGPPVHPPPYKFSPPDLPFPGAPHWQGASVGYGFSKVSGPAIVDGWNR